MDEPNGIPRPLVGWMAVGRLVWRGFALLGVAAAAGSGPGYGTDELAFDQYAAQLFAHFHNPYQHSMAPSLAMFHVSQYVTDLPS